MQSRHFVVSVYGDAHFLAWMCEDVKRMACKFPDAEVVVTEIAPEIYVGSALEKKVAEAMAREVVA